MASSHSLRVSVSFLPVMPPYRTHRSSHRPPHRPPPQPNPAIQSSEETTASSSHLLLADPIVLYPSLSRIRVHVIPTKLDGELPAIYAQIEALGGIVSALDECTFAVTALRGRPRLERIIGCRWLQSKQVLSVDYIKDCYSACLKYASIYTSSRPTIECPPAPTIPPRSEYLVANSGPPPFDNTPVDEPLPDHPPDLEPPDEDCPLEDIPRLAIKRCSPLICPNQDIVSSALSNGLRVGSLTNRRVALRSMQSNQYIN